MTPLRGLELEEVWCDIKSEGDREVLRSIKTLKQINGKPPAEVLKKVDKEPKP